MMIEVRACARLHLGLLDTNGEQGRLYGSIGLAIERPYLLLRAEKSDRFLVEGVETERVTIYATRFLRRYGLAEGVHLNMLSVIPAHVGLGSGTQIALAVGTALALLAGFRLTSEEIALAADRGTRSGVGIATFQHGGFILDGGHRVASSGQPERSSVPPILFRNPVPRSWYFVTVIPGTNQGLSGETEKSAFLHLPETSSQLVEKVSRLLLVKMLPALVEKDIVSFGQALTAIQRMVGDYFAPVQGGRFSNPISEKLIDFLVAKGAAGAGQSSWGPAVYGLIEGREPAHRLLKDVQNFLDGLGGGQAFCVRPQNRGATITDSARNLRKASKITGALK